MNEIRVHLFFSGRVQGVGFRYRAMYGAQALGLTGWVKNLWDGRVEMEVQGPSEKIDSLIAQLYSGTFIHITDCVKATIPPETESCFRIR